MKTYNSALVRYLNILKAFEIVNHQILLSKLEHSGVRVISYQLIIPYLSEFNRKQYIFIKQKTIGLYLWKKCYVFDDNNQ